MISLQSLTWDVDKKVTFPYFLDLTTKIHSKSSILPPSSQCYRRLPHRFAVIWHLFLRQLLRQLIRNLHRVTLVSFLGCRFIANCPNNWVEFCCCRFLALLYIVWLLLTVACGQTSGFPRYKSSSQVILIVKNCTEISYWLSEKEVHYPARTRI